MNTEFNSFPNYPLVDYIKETSNCKKATVKKKLDPLF